MTKKQQKPNEDVIKTTGEQKKGDKGHKKNRNTNEKRAQKHYKKQQKCDSQKRNKK